MATYDEMPFRAICQQAPEMKGVRMAAESHMLRNQQMTKGLEQKESELKA